MPIRLAHVAQKGMAASLLMVVLLRFAGEDEMQFHVGALVRGVVDKNAFTKFGLVHAVQELYGNAAAGKLLSAFSRLFTFFLQWHGFTCGGLRSAPPRISAPVPPRLGPNPPALAAP